ncbi:hypothetical protein J3A78_004347 [Streptomyces sp. PvR006]|uniref:hypothetical protein n=1 Tax=Streptomyces sp. PvR006 TaxID=2817860 RepID=UPI001AE87B5D|nr:hypothetical protein [Streptomyces sp. PvR006]MBP2583869.1 hypothetical protein [Streptomyces sp. PvR006]
MGIESDQLVYDYLSRVGDLAQQRQLPASDRMRLVSTLRNEIDRRRATHGEESPAAIRGILGALGTPDEVVERAEGPGAAPPGAGEPEGKSAKKPAKKPAKKASGKPAGKPVIKPVPEPRAGERAGERTGKREGRRFGWVPGSRRSREGTAPAVPKPAPAPDAAVTGPTGTTDPLGLAGPGAGPGGDTDWWQVDAAAGLPGFVGGVERPDLFRAPVTEDAEDTDDTEDAANTEDAGDGREGAEDEPAPLPGKRRRLARVLLRRSRTAPGAEPAAAAEPEAAPVSRLRLASPFVLLAALLLLGGALFGSLVALAAGWLIAYASRRLTPGEVKGAVLVIPGLAAASGMAWLWGRVEGRWGEPVAAGGEAMGAAVSETWPWVLRGAAVASALFLLWRARKH